MCDSDLLVPLSMTLITCMHLHHRVILLKTITSSSSTLILDHYFLWCLWESYQLHIWVPMFSNGCSIRTKTPSLFSYPTIQITCNSSTSSKSHANCIYLIIITYNLYINRHKLTNSIFPWNTCKSKLHTNFNLFPRKVL